ncbi:hypothetical protein BX600DRAFT_377016 [Xylariales sp. PMI_506]|nr:hypothetical protein BX600DRAFT_377016 [Xylariales sp. PMI_506]
MGKITKTIQPKHKETLTPWLQEFVQTASSTPLPLLPKFLATFPTRWPFPRGDLYHWIPLLNRFDSILESFCSSYKLTDGPQLRDFTCEVLLGSASGDQLWDEAKLSDLGYTEDGDVTLIVAVLKFTQMLLDHCGNRSIYASSPHLNHLLNSTDFSIICATLRVGVELAQRYQASVKRMGMANRQVSSALLSNHYNIDLDRVQQLAQPFVKTPLIKHSDPMPLSTPTASASKSRSHSSKPAASMYANDLGVIAKPAPDGSGSDSSPDPRWNGWGDVRISYYPVSGTSEPADKPKVPERVASSATPSTPTPLRRSNTANYPQSTPRSRQQPATDDSPSPGFRSPAMGGNENATPGQKSVEIPQSAVASTSIYTLLQRAPSDLPKEASYEFLNRLRVAKALGGSIESRQNALKARLLAIQNLAYIHTESTFVEKVLRQDHDEPRRFQLIYQLADLIHPSASGASDVPLSLQAIAFSLLEALSGFHTKLGDIFSALNAAVNHGVLLYVIRKAVAQMKEDDSGEQWTEEDEWRESLFSLTLHITMAMANNSNRNTPEIISAGLLDIMNEILTIRSNIAERTHATLLNFLDNLIYSVQSSPQNIITAEALDAVTDLITHEVDLARKLVADEQGTPPSCRSLVVDYEIPFYQQQNLKWLLKFIHHLMSNAFAFGGNTDRLLRNLVDKSALLRSLREIIINVDTFGSLVWTNAVSILSDFLNNDPTSFAAISEAGLVQSFLEAVTGHPVALEPASTPDAAEEDGDEASPAGDGTTSLTESDNRPHPPTREALEAPRTGPLARGIRPSSDAITIVPNVLNAISLNNQGMRMVVASRAFESYFEIFESPDHVRTMAGDIDIASNVGSNFDELARHHPALRPSITNAVLDMIARISHLGRLQASESGWGAKLVVVDASGNEAMADPTLLEGGIAATMKGKESEPSPTVDADVEMTDTENPAAQVSGMRSEGSSPQKSITPYILVANTFLTNYVSNPQLKQPLIQKGVLEYMLDLLTSPSLPHDFCESLAARTLQSVIAQLIESSPIIGMPSLLRRLQEALHTLKPMIDTPDFNSYFAPFLDADLTVTTDAPQERLAMLSNGTPVVKALLNAQCLMRTLYQCFPYSSRAQTITFPLVNVYDFYDRLASSLGPLLHAAVSQEMVTTRYVPSSWIVAKKETTSAPGQGQPAEGSNIESSDVIAQDDEAVLSDVISSAGVFRALNKSGAASKSEQASPRYRNYETIKVLLHSLMPTVFPILQSLGKALLSRRSERHAGDYARVHHIKLAHRLAETIYDQLDITENGENNRSVKHFNYWIIMVHTVHEMLLDRRWESRLPDRHGSAPHIIASVLVAFKQKGGFDKLNSMLRIFADEICKDHGEGEDSAAPRLAVIAMKKILELYAVMVNGKIVSESAMQAAFTSRSGNRTAETQIGQNLVVELRMAIFPVMQELWKSPVMDKVSDPIVNKIVEILKSISTADYENQAYRRSDKTVPPPLLKSERAPFMWHNYTATIEQLKRDGYEEDLAQEALYRANGSPQAAIDYCKAHKEGIAGDRNPIPESDSPEKATPEESKQSAEAAGLDNLSSEDLGSGEGPMVLDLPADIPQGLLDDEEMLGEFNEAAGNTTFSSRATPSIQQDASVAGPSTGTTGQAAVDETETEAKTAIPKEDLDAKRAELRVSLIDRCLDVIRVHPDSSYEVSELISAAVIRSSTDDSAKQEIGETLANALMSFAADEDLGPNGRSIAAYAHLLSLLLQNRGFFQATASSLRDTVSEFLRLLQVPSQPTEELAPWIPYVLLIFEILLSDDEQPSDIKWKSPANEDETIEPLQWDPKDLIVKEDDRRILLEAILDILPKVGKQESLAISVLRILVILTRDRTTARVIGDKKNLQRLFVMTKQLSGFGSARLSETRISSYVLTILRHIIEDEEIIKQLMRSEIRSMFDNSRTQRPVDVNGYIRQLSHVALRDPRLFVEVSNEMVRLSRWSYSEGTSSRHHVILQEPKVKLPSDDVTPAVQATEDLSIHDVKPSMENENKQVGDAKDAKHGLQDTKRPVLENPDGVIHFLLCELLNYKEVDDKEPTPTSKDPKEPQDTTEPSASPAPNDSTDAQADSRAAENKDKKAKIAFKTDEHPIFIYRCFLLRCLTELLQSYNQTKVEFINFKRSAPLQTNTPIKPRSSVLNYLLVDLLCPGHVDAGSDSLSDKKRHATAIQAQHLLVALVSKTGEKPVDRNRDKYDYDEEPDLLFVRRFVLDTILKAYKDASTSNEPFELRYGRMLAFAEVMHQMMGAKDKDANSNRHHHHDSSPARSEAQIRRLMYEKGYLATLTASIADIDLAYPPVKKTVKQVLNVLRVLTSTAIQLSNANILPAASTLEDVEDDIASATSLSDVDDDREETPDLYRNSALGMLEPGRDHEDYSEDSDDDLDDEEMYEDEYGDEMEYEEEVSVDGEEDVSDEDEDVEGMGPIEGLPGDLGVVEVTMDDDDDEDEDDEDDMDEDEEMSDDDDLGSEEMDELANRIEIVDEEGNPVDDDGGSGWESDTDDEEDDDEEIDYEADVQDLDEAQLHGLNDVDNLRFGNLMHAIEEDEDDYDGADDINNANVYPDEDDEDEDDDDDEDMEDPEFAFDNYLDDAPPPHAGLPSMGWDTMVLDRSGNALEDPHHHHHRHRHGFRSPFPPMPFMIGGRDPLSHFGDMRNFMRSHRNDRPNGNEDGLNPLLRRVNDGGRDASPRPLANGLVRLLGGNGESPLSLINDLLTSLPNMRNAGLQFHITQHGPRGEMISEFAVPLGNARDPVIGGRREAYQDPAQAASFATESTMNRWIEETKMVFGMTHPEKSAKLVPAILSHLVPPAIQRDKEARARDAEVRELRLKQEEERRKREEDERKAREAKEAEERAAKEQAEAEERARAAAEAAELAAQAGGSGTTDGSDQGVDDTVEAMEGVETGDDTTPTGESTNDQPRVLTTIRGEQVDVTELGIDADYLEALPEEFREEVIAQTISQRRSQAREAPRRTGEQTEVFQEFLDALPEELRQEIVQQERAEQRRREREEARRQNAAAGQEAVAQEMDTASILMTFPPALREQVLMDQGADLMDSLPPEMAAEARRLVRTHPAVVHRAREEMAGRVPDPAQPTGSVEPAKPQRKTIVQMLDKSGVATLLRLMFINVKGGSMESPLKHVIKDICENKQTRLEVVSTLLQILQDGTTDLEAVERSFAQLSIKAKQPRDRDGKTPQSLKRSYTNISHNSPVHTSSETSPVLIVQQCLDLLCFLADEDVHVPGLFLTEHETVGSTLKRSLSRKGKGKGADSKAQKYAINSLLAMLDRDVVIESSAIMDSLSQLLNRVTMPLLALDRKLKEADETIKELDKQIEEAELKLSAPQTETTAGGQSSEAPGADATEKSSADGPEANDATQTSAPENSSIENVAEKLAKAKERREFVQKRVKTYVAPQIPVHNLTMVINIFVARECSSKTFKETLSAIKNISVIPNAMDVFGEELARQARVLSEKIVVHLDELLPHIESASTGTEIQGVALAKFSPGAADQNKLLRVLTALDHLFSSKKPGSSEGSDLSNETKKQDLLATLYRNPTFNALWERLSACLSAIRQRESLINVATILLPLIEALMVVCKDTAASEAAAANQSQAAKEMLLSSPPPELPMTNLFLSFTEDHRRILNELVRNNPSLMKGTFANLVKNPKVLEFDNKRNWFNRSVHNRNQIRDGRSFPTLQLSVRRDQVFHDSFKSLYFKSGDEMKFGKLNIRFHGEEGVDAGGVTREWFQVLSRQMFDPNYALFVPVSSDRTTFHPNKLSGINDEHLMFFKFIGRVIGKALYEGRVLDCYFSRAVYKRILGKPVSVKDMESFDPDYYKSLVWMLENDITDIITETFSVETDEFGVTIVEDLVENGRNIPVTEENKQDYVRLVVEHKLLKSVKEQMENFLKGFHEIIPAELVSIFNEQELELLISGLPDIDVDDWKSNTEYQNYTPSSQQIQWFWRAVRSLDKEELAKLLQFVTGTSKVPLNGFKELEGMNGINRFNIHRDYGNKDRLPSSHTCFNQLDLPEYDSYETLRQNLLKAITAGSDYFGFA